MLCAVLKAIHFDSNYDWTFFIWVSNIFVALKIDIVLEITPFLSTKMHAFPLALFTVYYLLLRKAYDLFTKYKGNSIIIVGLKHSCRFKHFFYHEQLVLLKHGHDNLSAISILKCCDAIFVPASFSNLYQVRMCLKSFCLWLDTEERG